MDLDKFVGRMVVERDIADTGRIGRLTATLDDMMPAMRDGVLPPLGHWLHFLPCERRSALGQDGHPRRTDDGLLPNVDLPRRMWAGSRVAFHHDIPFGSPITRTSTVTSAKPKHGRSGTLLFVSVRHEIAVDGGPTAIVEDQDIVYRDAPAAGAPFVRQAEAAGQADPVTRQVTADPVMLFRYSALTFNGHRIHYDHDYVRGEEGYPGLVVHGPLIATLMLYNLLHERASDRVDSFSFRAASPLFDGEAFTLGARVDGPSAALRAIGPAGVAMIGTAELSPGA